MMMKRTLKRLDPMSALPPKADIVWHRGNVRFVPKADIRLFDHVVGARKKARWHFEAEGFSRLSIESQFVFGRCLYRKVSRFLTLEDAIDVAGRAVKQINRVRTV